MQFKIGIILLFIFILANKNLLAQQTSILKDTAKIYDEIESFSSQRRITKYMYRLVFVPTSSSTKVGKTEANKKKINKSYRAFEGKIIRKIEIETLDPFGYSIGDTMEVYENIISKTSNTLHIKSKERSILNLLLIRKNQVFDSLLVRESERLVRSRPYIQEVSFYVKSTARKSDSVDIFIRVLDNWSLSSKIEGSPTSPTFNLTEKNFLGMGHESKTNLTRFHPENDYAYNSSYYIPNIRNTFINSTIGYTSDRNRNYNGNFAVDRPFFSSFAKWAAGASISRQFHRDSLRINDSIIVFQGFKLNVQDYWAGYSFKIFKGNTEFSRTTNLISSIRFLQTTYLLKPSESIDTLHIYSNENFYLAALGISTRSYVQDRFIFKYGVIEDVPVGKVFSLTGGYQERNNIGRLYLGTRVSYSKYFAWGYFSSNIEYGSFYRLSHAEQGTFSFGANYFTDLLEIGNWKIRQFAKSQVTFGINRLSYENLSINDGYGIDGFNSDGLTGTNRFLFTIQTQSYAPWNFIGFRFGPYLSYSLGMLSNDKRGFDNSKMYQQISLGVLIKNEYLIINTFQFSISFFPIIPGNGLDVFKANSFRTNDFGFRDYGIGKPGTILFQ